MKDTSPTSETTNPDRKMSLPTRGRRPSMFDPIDPKELQQALYASAVSNSLKTTKKKKTAFRWVESGCCT
jgi:hypothetical protein